MPRDIFAEWYTIFSGGAKKAKPLFNYVAPYCLLQSIWDPQSVHHAGTV